MNTIKNLIALAIIFVLRKIRHASIWLAKATGSMVVTDDIWEDIRDGRFGDADAKLVFAIRMWGLDPDISYALSMMEHLKEDLRYGNMASNGGNTNPTMARNNVDRGG